MAHGNSRKEELLAAARDRLTQEQTARSAGRSVDDSGPEIRYRGKVVQQGRRSATPGSGSISRPQRSSDADNDVRIALLKIKALYHDGLISRAEAEKKRSEILDRL